MTNSSLATDIAYLTSRRSHVWQDQPLIDSCVDQLLAPITAADLAIVTATIAALATSERRSQRRTAKRAWAELTAPF